MSTYSRSRHTLSDEAGGGGVGLGADLEEALVLLSGGREPDSALEEGRDCDLEEVQASASESESDSDSDSRSMSHSPDPAGGHVSRAFVATSSPSGRGIGLRVATKVRSDESLRRRFLPGRGRESQATVRSKPVRSSGSGVWLGLRRAASTKGLSRRGGGD